MWLRCSWPGWPACTRSPTSLVPAPGTWASWKPTVREIGRYIDLCLGCIAALKVGFCEEVFWSKEGGSGVGLWSGLGLGTACSHPGCSVGKGHVHALLHWKRDRLLQVVQGGSPAYFCLLLLQAHLSMFFLLLVVSSYSPAWSDTTPAVVLS